MKKTFGFLYINLTESVNGTLQLHMHKKCLFPWCFCYGNHNRINTTCSIFTKYSKQISSNWALPIFFKSPLNMMDSYTIAHYLLNETHAHGDTADSLLASITFSTPSKEKLCMATKSIRWFSTILTNGPQKKLSKSLIA